MELTKELLEKRLENLKAQKQQALANANTYESQKRQLLANANACEGGIETIQLLLSDLNREEPKKKDLVNENGEQVENKPAPPDQNDAMSTQKE